MQYKILLWFSCKKSWILHLVCLHSVFVFLINWKLSHDCNVCIDIWSSKLGFNGCLWCFMILYQFDLQNSYSIFFFVFVDFRYICMILLLYRLNILMFCFFVFFYLFLAVWSVSYILFEWILILFAWQVAEKYYSCVFVLFKMTCMIVYVLIIFLIGTNAYI